MAEGLAVQPVVQQHPRIPTLDTAPASTPAGTNAAHTDNPLASFMLPSYTEDDYNAVGAGASTPTSGGKAADLIAYAKQFIGTPYKWGGSGPLGFDCSGFTQYVFKKFGVDLPRVSYQQGGGGVPVDPKNGLQPGDLIFWDNSARNNGADHVALYLGNGQIIAAPKPGDHVKIEPIYGNYWARRYL